VCGVLCLQVETPQPAEQVRSCLHRTSIATSSSLSVVDAQLSRPISNPDAGKSTIAQANRKGKREVKKVAPVVVLLFPLGRF